MNDVENNKCFVSKVQVAMSTFRWIIDYLQKECPDSQVV